MTSSSEEEQYSMRELVEAATLEEFDAPDLTISLEIVDRVNSSKSECKEAVETLGKILKNAKSHRLYLSLQLLELLIKNCSLEFHSGMNSKNTANAFLKILKKRRGKTGFLDKLFLDNHNLEKIENKALEIIMIWGLSFESRRKDFAHLVELYHQLIQEKIKFPGDAMKDSFLLDLKRMTPFTPKDTKSGKRESKSGERKKKKKQENNKKGAEKNTRNGNDSDDDLFYRECKEVLSFIDEDEIETIRTSSLLLDEIIQTSSCLRDLEIGKDFIANMRESYRRIVEVIKERKDYTEQEHDVTMELKQRVQTISCQYKSRSDFLQSGSEKGDPSKYKFDEEDDEENIFADNRSTRSHEDLDSLRLENHKDSDNEGFDGEISSSKKKKTEILYIDIKFNMGKTAQLAQLKTLQGFIKNPKLQVIEDFDLEKSIERIEALLAQKKEEEENLSASVAKRFEEIELTKSDLLVMDSEKLDLSTNCDQSTLDSANSFVSISHNTSKVKGVAGQLCFDDFDVRDEKGIKTEALVN